ncbi:disks large homolog 5-like [Lingula anatina]|uniref:Disks large homolog 5-like n=1 Tax=Lingula anatina TaxID=7574 RepID=A0A1S3IQ18_LINAN|nr:disks large homolog 5-like [Lingula anatina]|eukprot:XP_013400011.1 disks large homolog 5-like [Lingula anatina]
MCFSLPQGDSSSTVDRATPTPSEEQFPYGGVSAPKAYHSSGQLEHSDGFSTFPKRGHHHPHHTARIRIPSQDSVNNSVSKIIWSAGSLSDRSSPMSPYLHLEHPGTNSSTGSIPSVEPPRTRKKPEIGETRHISIEKTFQPLGIQIKPGKNGSGIFISSVGQNSLAEHYGLEVGDQILEVCGLSLRTANETQAAIVLRQCGDSMTMLVQYLPDKFEDNGEDSGSSQSSRATSPATSPKLVKHGSNETITSSTPTNSPRNNPNNQSSSSQDSHVPMEPRFVFLQKSAASSLGISLIGGNAVGIFVHEVQKDSVACGPNGLRCGDQILEFNGVDLRSATAEQAAHELSKPSERVTILARYDIVRYNKIRDQPGDSFYIRTLFDRQAENEGELSFKRDDVLYIEDTLYNGMPGTWKAWLVDDEGNKLQCGTIPSKYRMEDELAMKRSLSESLQEEELKNASSRRGSATARRSFFRRKKHQRNNSKDSRELASFSDVSINTDSVPILDDGTVLTYQRVERLDYKVCRPVMILGPLAEPLINKLTSESPDKYCRCESMPMKALAGSVEKALSDGQLVDYRIKDDHYECITVEAVKQIVEKNRHAMLDVSAHAIERLHRLQIYPIVLYCKHKSSKELREVKDTRFLPEKMTSKSAKQLYEQFQKVEQDCRHLFSSMVQGGNSLAYMSTQIKSAIDIEQKKTIWVPSGNI